MYSSEIMVSVICLAYNHEDYIRKCLEGFVMQKTDFKFEVLVHDDCSTDKTKEIIEEYAGKYSDIIVPVYETENQHSKKVKISRDILRPIARGKYIAFCEGDDCWISEDKLQKQVDFLEANPDYSCCLHCVRVVDVKTGNVSLKPNIVADKDYDIGQTLRKGILFQTSALMVRGDLWRNSPEWAYGEYSMYIYYQMCGKCKVISDTMSQYNYGTPGSWTERTKKAGFSEVKAKQTIEKLKKANEFSEYRFNDEFTYAIRSRECNIFVETGKIGKALCPPYSKFFLLYLKRKMASIVARKLPFVRTIKQTLERKLHNGAR